MSINNPLENIPLNTKRMFIMGVTYCGCEIYLPLRSRDDKYIAVMKQRLQNHLNKQKIPPEFNQTDPPPRVA